MLDGFPTVFPAGERFSYNNGAYVVLAILVAQRERASAITSSCARSSASPAGMVDDRRSCAPTSCRPRRRSGYLGRRRSRGRTCCTSRSSVSATAACTRPRRTCTGSGRRSSPGASSASTRWPRWCVRAATSPHESERNGMGFHLAETGDEVWLEGYDAGVSFGSSHPRSTEPASAGTADWSDAALAVATRATVLAECSRIDLQSAEMSEVEGNRLNFWLVDPGEGHSGPHDDPRRDEHEPVRGREVHDAQPRGDRDRPARGDDGRQHPDRADPPAGRAAARRRRYGAPAGHHLRCRRRVARGRGPRPPWSRCPRPPEPRSSSRPRRRR